MATAASARIVIAERWAILRRGITGILQTRYPAVEGIAEVGDLAPLLQARDVNVVIIGGRAGMDVPAVVAHLHAVQPCASLVVLCDHVDPDTLRSLLQAGASAVLSKKLGDDTLLDAVARVLAGERVVDQPFLPLLFGMEDPKSAQCDAESLLTPREHDVLLELARGATNREIAETLVMSESTVKSHLRRIYAKLEVSGRHGAVGRAMELELLA